MSPSILDDPLQHQIETPPASSSSKKTSQITKKKNKNAASVANQSVAEYFEAKKALLSNAEADTINQKIDRQQGSNMFLLSLVLELEELNDSQIKLFKRQILRVIDDISASEHHQQPRSSSGLTILTSPSMSDSRDSQMNVTHLPNVTDQMHTADFYDAFSQSLTGTNM